MLSPPVGASDYGTSAIPTPNYTDGVVVFRMAGSRRFIGSFARPILLVERVNVLEQRPLRTTLLHPIRECELSTSALEYDVIGGGPFTLLSERN